MAFQRLKRKKFNRALRKAGIGRDTRKEASGIFGDKRKTKIREGESRISLEKKLKRETDLSYSERQRVLKAHKGSQQDPKETFSPSRPDPKETFSPSRPDPKDAYSTQGQEDRFKASKPRFGSKSSDKNYDKLRQQFGGSKAGVGFTDRGSKKTSSRPRRSLFGKRLGGS